MSEWTPAERALATEVENSKERINKLEKEIKIEEERIKKLQSFCEHRQNVHHHREIAEDNSYNECKICGKIF